MNVRGIDPHPFQSIKERRQDQSMRDGPGLVADGNGNGSDSPEAFDASFTERMFEAFKDRPFGISNCGDSVGPKDICLPARRKINGDVPLAVWNFEREIHFTIISYIWDWR